MEFKNIRRQAQKDLEASTKKVIDFLKVGDIATNWSYQRELTARQKEKTEAEQRVILIKKEQRKAAKRWEAINAKITEIENAPDLLSLSISVEWKPSRMWGANPRASARIHTADGWQYTESGSVSGCGYDKQSTATAEALNQSTSVLKELYKAFEKALKHNKTAALREVLGYGSGYGRRPYFEGGVGVSCLYTIFKNCGFIFENTASGKMFESYTVTKATKK